MNNYQLPKADSVGKLFNKTVTCDYMECRTEWQDGWPQLRHTP